MSVWSDSVLAVEAREADDAILDTLLTPRPKTNGKTGLCPLVIGKSDITYFGKAYCGS